MYSSNNNGNGSFSPYFPLSTSFFGHETLFIPQNPNFLQHDFPNFVDPISNGFVKHFSPSYESDIPKEMPKKKKDMNRKINTARGPRERRVRLSLNVAQKFFDLQDMLGFDKASETLDWLLGQSNSAIKELKRVSDRYVNSINNHKKSANCNSNCEVLLDQANEASKQIDMKGNFTGDKRTSKPLSQVVGRDSRSKARERARKRTKEKMGAIRACDIMHLGTSCPIMNENEVPNYSDTMMVNCLNEHDACLKVSKEQRTCTIGDSYSINVSLMKPFPNSNNMNSSNDYENWENIGALAHRPQPFSYLKSSPLDTGLQNL